MKFALLLLSLMTAFVHAAEIDVRSFPIRKREELNAREYQPLLPERFRFADQVAGKPIADQITLRIFDSASARESLCFLSSFEIKEMSLFLGVSSAAAQGIKKKCAGYSVRESDRGVLRAMAVRILGDSRTNQRAKEYAFLFATVGEPAIEGFTGRDGLTLIIVNENEASEARLVRILAHELAMSFDQLGSLGTRYSASETWQRGLSAIFPSRDGFLGTVFEKHEDDAEINCALFDPAIRYAAATERAFRFEDRVIRDLGLSSPGMSAPSSGVTCQRILAVRAVQMSPLAPTLEIETSDPSYRMSCGVELLKDARRKETLVSRIKAVHRAVLTLKSDGSKVRLCDLILNPHIGPRMPENGRHSGPRPRVGGWEGE